MPNLAPVDTFLKRKEIRLLDERAREMCLKRNVLELYERYEKELRFTLRLCRQYGSISIRKNLHHSNADTGI